MKILIIDDETDFASLLARSLQAEGHEAAQASTGAEGLVKAKSFLPQAILLDINMPDISGLELLPDLLKSTAGASVVMITGQASHKSAVTAMKLGAEDYIEKPFDPDELRQVLRRIGEKADLKQQVASLKRGRMEDYAKEYLFLQDPAMLKVYRSIEDVADKEKVNVLIEGETGTGKEHAARLLHLASARAAGPFVELHCAAIPETLIESELFGHESGAYTDARKAKPGLFETAQGGTVFLDEVGELPLNMQTKLLKVLEQRSLRRLGGVQNIALDVRVVSATNRDLQEEVRLGHFRADLYYRLNVYSVKIPPLRSRPQDIGQLASFFFSKACQDFQRKLEPLDTYCLLALEALPWHGNVRELKNFIERLAIQAQGTSVSLEELQLALPGHGKTTAASQASDAAERQRLESLLQRHAGDKSKAAAELGVSRPTLYRKLKQHGLFSKDL
jgi:two-component system response regulator AtoC